MLEVPLAEQFPGLFGQVKHSFPRRNISIADVLTSRSSSPPPESKSTSKCAITNPNVRGLHRRCESHPLGHPLERIDQSILR